MNKTLQLRNILILWCTLSFTGLSAQEFTDVTELDGITIVHDGEDPSIDDFMDMATGAAWLDFNNDGNLDLYITMRTGANLLFENLGYDATANDYIFDEVAVAKGVADMDNDGAGVSIADIDNDGNIDIFLANVDGDKLFKNDGSPDYTFTDITTGSGLEITNESRGTSASWGDYDGDGFLDLYLSNHVGKTGSTSPTNQDFLFHNNGNETFTDVSGLLGIPDLMGYGFIGGWTDIDKDGDMDLIVINDCDLANPNPIAQTHTRIFKNNSHLSGSWNTWNFTEESIALGVDDCRNGMGIAVGDLDRDGWMDFFYTNIGECVLFKNDGDGTFTDISASAGIDNQVSTNYSWGCGFLDYNLDGYQDIVVTLGALNVDSNTHPWKNQLFENNGDNTFTDVAGNAGANMDDDTKSRSAIYGDYDNDGDIDVFYMSYGEQCVLKRNEHINASNTGNNWLQVKLTGDPNEGSNMDAVGAKLKLTYGVNDDIQYYETKSGSNLGGGDDIRAYFGLGSETTISSLEITWPSGNVQTETNITSNQLIQVSELLPLPVELVEFNAQPRNKQVVLDWTTATEIENAYFVVERSDNSRSFQSIGRVAGNGNTTSFSSYDFIDEDPIKGDNYYRLIQTDFDGTETASAVRVVTFESESTEVRVIPNPVKSQSFTLSYKGSEEEVSVGIFDVFGKQVYTDLIQDGINQQINIANLPNGIYVVRLSGELIQHTEKLILSK